MNIEDLKILALIPARGGSKRLPGKNIKDLCGKPLIAWTIEAALKSKYLDSVVVSTDCSEIADISKKYGAEVPFIRPETIALDTSSTLDVVKHCIDFCKSKNNEFTHILLLQPTSPLRMTEDIDCSIDLLLKKKAKAIYSVCETEHSPLWSNTLPEDNSFDDFLRPEVNGKRSQDLPKYFRLNGSIYLVDITELLKVDSLNTVTPSYAYIMDRKASIDIDEDLDFKVAEAIMKTSRE